MDLDGLKLSSYPKRNKFGNLVCDINNCQRWRDLHTYCSFHMCDGHWKLVGPFLPPEITDYPISELTRCTGLCPAQNLFCTIENCASHAIHFNNQQHLCAYHLQCWYTAAQHITGDDGLPQCHAKHCTEQNPLMFGYSRLWCPNHYQTITDIRSRITHFHTRASFQARLEEAYFTAEVDEGHINCIEYINLHISQKASNPAAAACQCTIVDCYNTDIIQDRGQFWCTSHLSLAGNSVS